MRLRISAAEVRRGAGWLDRKHGGKFGARHGVPRGGIREGEVLGKVGILLYVWQARSILRGGWSCGRADVGVQQGNQGELNGGEIHGGGEVAIPEGERWQEGRYEREQSPGETSRTLSHSGWENEEE